jgi:predicted PurR-regulated permease PerM
MAIWEPSRTQVGWGALGIILGITVVLILYEFIGTLAFAVFVYYAIRPIYQRFIDRFEHPDIAATLTIVLVVGPMLLVLTYTLLIGLHELRHFFQSVDLTQYDTILDTYPNISILYNNQSVTNILFHHPLKLLELDLWHLLIQYRRRILVYLETIANILLRLFLLFSFTFYLLRDDHKIAAWLRDSFEDRHGMINEYMSGVDEDLRTLYFGNLVHVLVIALFAFVIYQLINISTPVGTNFRCRRSSRCSPESGVSFRSLV